MANRHFMYYNIFGTCEPVEVEGELRDGGYFYLRMRSGYIAWTINARCIIAAFMDCADTPQFRYTLDETMLIDLPEWVQFIVRRTGYAEEFAQ